MLGQWALLPSRSATSEKVFHFSRVITASQPSYAPFSRLLAAGWYRFVSDTCSGNSIIFNGRLCLLQRCTVRNSFLYVCKLVEHSKCTSRKRYPRSFWHPRTRTIANSLKHAATVLRPVDPRWLLQLRCCEREPEPKHTQISAQTILEPCTKLGPSVEIPSSPRLTSHPRHKSTALRKMKL